MDMCFFRSVSPLLWVVRIHVNPYALRFSGSFPGSGLPSFGSIAGCLVRTGLAIDSRKSVWMLRDPLVLDLAFAFAGGHDLHSRYRSFTACEGNVPDKSVEYQAGRSCRIL